MASLSPKRSRGSKDLESPGTSRATRQPSLGRRRRTRTPRGKPPDIPDLELSEEDFLKEWGITKDQEELKLIEFRRMVESEVGPLRPQFDKYYLRRFLRARQHDLRRATDMFKAHLKWRAEFGTDTIMEDFHFHERDPFLSLYPQGYHKTDRLGRPIYIQHLGAINVKALQEVTTVERMVRFHVQEYERALRYIFPACSLVAGTHVSQTLAIMDLKGVGLRHLTGEVKNILSSITRIDQDNYPETLGKTLIINAPAVFRAIWAVVKPMLDPRTQAKIEVCPADYMKVLTRWVDPENIPQYLGGRSAGSLIDDVGLWNDPALIGEVDAQRAKSSQGEEGTPRAAVMASTSPGPAVSLQRQTEGGGTTSAEPLLGNGQAAGSDIRTDDDSEPFGVFHDALARRMSSASTITSAYLSADDGDLVSTSDGPESDAPRAGMRRPTPLSTLGAHAASSDGESVAGSGAAPAYRLGSKSSVPSPSLQIPLLARVQALEDKLPAMEGRLRGYLPGGQDTPSRSVGQGTLVARVGALEKAMDTLLRAQQVAMEKPSENKSRGCCACCSVM